MRQGKKKIKSDVLVVMYLNAVNNLNDALYSDLNEVEYGLSLIRKADGSPKEAFQDVNVVALWDGFAGNSSMTPFLGDSGSHLYLLGADSCITPDGFSEIGPNTIELTSTVP